MLTYRAAGWPDMRVILRPVVLPPPEPEAELPCLAPPVRGIDRPGLPDGAEPRYHSFMVARPGPRRSSRGGRAATTLRR